MERNDLGELVQRIRGGLAPHEDVLFAYLFGSAAKGRARPDSDVDLAVFFQAGDRRAYASGALGSGAGVTEGGDPEGATERSRRGRRTLAIEADLERAVGRRVQVVSLNDAPLGLAHNVLKTGRLVLSSDDGAHRRFFVGHARRYFDMEGARRLFDRYRARRIEEGTFGGRERHGP